MTEIASLSIGQVAEQASVSVSKLRYYEKRGLIDPPLRVSGQRRYDPAVLMRLMVISACQTAGFTLAEIGEVLNDASPDRSATRTLARARLSEIEDQIRELRLAQMMLEAAIECGCSSVEQCICGAMDPTVAALLSRLGPP